METSFLIRSSFGLQGLLHPSSEFLPKRSLRSLDEPSLHPPAPEVTPSSHSSAPGVIALTGSGLAPKDTMEEHTGVAVTVFENSNILYEYWNTHFLIGALVICFGIALSQPCLANPLPGILGPLLYYRMRRKSRKGSVSWTVNELNQRHA